MSIIYLHWCKINTIITFHLNLEEIKIMPVGKMLLLLFFLAVSPWEALPDPCLAHTFWSSNSHWAQLKLSSPQLHGVLVSADCSHPTPCSRWLRRHAVTCCSIVPSAVPPCRRAEPWQDPRGHPGPRREEARRNPQDILFSAHFQPMAEDLKQVLSPAW